MKNIISENLDIIINFFQIEYYIFFNIIYIEVIFINEKETMLKIIIYQIL